jgi:hypothetical protein
MPVGLPISSLYSRHHMYLRKICVLKCRDLADQYKGESSDVMRRSKLYIPINIDHVLESADKRQQNAAHEGKKLEMDNSKDFLVPDEA